MLHGELTLHRFSGPGSYHVWSSGGAELLAGRWHERGDAVIYTNMSYALVVLESLVHRPGLQFIEGMRHVTATAPIVLSREIVTLNQVAGWNALPPAASRAFGHDWYDQRRSCLLIVPSMFSHYEMNVIVNTQHDDYDEISVSHERPALIDRRLLQPPSSP